MSIELPAEILQRRRELTGRLVDGVIIVDEAQELHDILEEEKQQAEDTNDFLALFAIAGLLLLLASILYEGSKKKKKKA